MPESDCDTSSGESTDEDEDELSEPCNLSLNQTHSSFCLRNHIPGVTELIKTSHYPFQ